MVAYSTSTPEGLYSSFGMTVCGMHDTAPTRQKLTQAPVPTLSALARSGQLSGTAQPKFKFIFTFCIPLLQFLTPHCRQATAVCDIADCCMTRHPWRLSS